eukprot:scaffold75678_cov31-Tisochrysis_lutea.AAC.5
MVGFDAHTSCARLRPVAPAPRAPTTDEPILLHRRLRCVSWGVRAVGCHRAREPGARGRYRGSACAWCPRRTRCRPAGAAAVWRRSLRPPPTNSGKQPSHLPPQEHL